MSNSEISVTKIVELKSGSTYKITCKHNGTSEWITYEKDIYGCTAKGNSL